MPRNLQRLPQAIDDALNIWVRIALDNPSAADIVAERVDEAIRRLADYPELGPERPNLGKGIRLLPVDNILIIYRLTDAGVEILRILHAARDITPDLLSE
jgi:toxin ParE1/3/4